MLRGVVNPTDGNGQPRRKKRFVYFLFFLGFWVLISLLEFDFRAQSGGRGNLRGRKDTCVGGIKDCDGGEKGEGKGRKKMDKKL
jgi:hypothetical protein